MPLFSSREKEEKFLTMEAQGIDPRTSVLSNSGFTTLKQLWKSFIEDSYDKNLDENLVDTVSYFLRMDGNSLEVQWDLYGILDRDLNLEKDKEFRNLTEAWLETIKYLEYRNIHFFISSEELEERINQILQRERYDKRLIQGEILPYSYSLAHKSVDAVFLYSKHQNVKEKFKEALEEFAKEKYAGSITKAAVALERFLDHYEFGQGEALGKKINAAHKAGAIADIDLQIWQWTAATRNKKSDSHNGTEPTKHQAWSFMEICASLLERYETEWI